MTITTSYISGTVESQTPENTTMPHEAAPGVAPAAPERPEYTPEGHKIYYRGDRKPVIRVNGRFQSLDPNYKPKPKKPKVKKVEAVAVPAPTPPVSGMTEGDRIMQALVQKLVAFENDPQYVAVWTNFFRLGGVYNGVRYVDELRAAIEYLIKKT